MANCFSEKSNVKDICENTVFSGEVLVCDDDELNCQTIRNYLLKAGLAPIIVSDGKEGVAAAKTHMDMGRPFDLILMDINMPIMDGITATKKLLGMGVKAPIIALTSNAGLCGKFYTKFGMSDYLIKPYSVIELWTCLSKYLTVISLPQAGGANGVNNPVINRKAGIESCAGEVIYSRLLALFAKDNQSTFQNLHDAVEAGDTELAIQIAHTLKGTAGMIGAVSLQKAAQDMEAALSGNTSVTYSGLMQSIEKELNAALTVLTPAQTQGFDYMSI